MHKMLPLALLMTLAFTCAYPNGGEFNERRSRRSPVSEYIPEELRKFNDLNCLNERYGEPCWYEYSISIYKLTVDCERYVYRGCFNNQTRIYYAEMCNGECRLPPNNGYASTNGDSASDSVTASFLSQLTLP